MRCDCQAYCWGQYYSSSTHTHCNPQAASIFPRGLSGWSSIEPPSFMSVGKLNELRNALNTERNVRSIGGVGWEGNTTFFQSSAWLQIQASINACRANDGVAGFSYIDPYTVGSTITKTGIYYFQAYINTLQSVCICNCNYCPCNCNYCTCNCNYCPCNCNWGCPCNCNYSDKRLKENIKYF